MTDYIFHILDIQARDMRIESETDDVREISYESHSDSDDEFKSRKRKKANNFNTQKEFVIHLFGADDKGKHVRCDVTGFRPTLYLRLPENKTAAAADTIKQYINSQGIPMGEVHIKRITKKVFYGFTANTFYPFLQINVSSLTLFRTIRNLFLDDALNPITKKNIGIKVEVFEANIDPMLRFIHTQNIQPCGWVLIKNAQIEDSVIECDYKDVIPTTGPLISAPFLTASWDIECLSMTGDFPLAKRTWKKAAKEVVHLARDSIHAIELIINSLSSEKPVETLPKGMTPIYCTLKKPLDFITNKLIEAQIDDLNDVDELEKILEKTLKNVVYLVGDPVIQIGTALMCGNVEQHLFVFPDCDPIPGIIVHSYKTEKTMILAWFKWIIEKDPDILIGYNIFGFDESYLWHRAEELGIITGNSIIHQFTRLFALSSEMKLEEKFLSSSAMGDNRMYIWTTHGRLQIDLYHYIKRNNTLPSYKLDEVTKHFMSGKLKKYSYNAGKLYLDVAGAIKDVKPGRAITLLDDTGESVTDKLIVESVEGNTIVCSVDDDIEDIDDATKWVVVKDDVSPQDIFRLHRESSSGRAIVGKYCLQDCTLVLDLYKKLETFNNSMCMANVCSVPISYIFTRGQGIKIESLIFKACRERDILIPVLSTPIQNDDSFEGAIVLDPEPGFYCDSPIGVCDFASLYPSSIVSENISHDSLLWVKDFKYDGTLISHIWGSEVYDDCEGYAYTDIEFDIWRPDPTDTRKHPVKIKCGRRICRYAQPLDGTKSTLPQITTWLLQARELKKKEMKGEKDPERYALLDAEQLAYKLTGNSLYGQLGSGTFKIRLQALAASVTAYGRKQILFAKDAIEKFYGADKNLLNCNAKVVYGDTDSLFVEFNPRDSNGERLQGREARQATIELTDEAGAFITKVLAAPHDFEFDKAFDPFLIFSKKRYAGNMYENNADDYVHKYMGIALKRRDNAPIVKTIFGGAMKMLLDNRDVSGAFTFVKSKCMELVEGKVNLGQLTVTKSLRAEYANPLSIAHKVLADRITQRDPGNAPASGDRIGYIYISPKSGEEASKLQGDRIETPLFVKENNLIPDYRHYIEYQLQNPISQAFGIVLEKIPGFTPSMLSDDRENVAAKLLFSDCLKKFETSNRRNALVHMFGNNIIINTSKKAKIEKPAAVKKQITQMPISNYLLDTFLVDNIRKNERASAVAAKKKIKELSLIL